MIVYKAIVSLLSVIPTWLQFKLPDRPAALAVQAD
jgi:hypothetical protein